MDTDRLELRPLYAADAEQLFPILSDSALYTYTGDKPPASHAALRKLYAFREGRRSPDGDELRFNWAINIPARGQLVGYAQATVTVDRADVAWVVGKNWQERGYATEVAKAVVDWLHSIGVLRIHANINCNYAANHRVAEKSGFQRTSQIANGEEVWVWGET